MTHRAIASARPGSGSFGAFLAAIIGASCLARPAFAFDSTGHNLIEALACRTLVEGYQGQPRLPDVLRDLINDGTLDTPWCFGQGDERSSECLEAPAENPLLCWPQPKTDRPDASLRRQLDDPGQCFHDMGRYAELLDPFLTLVSASLGYRYRTDGGGSGIVGRGAGLVPPVGLKADIGFTAAEFRTVFGGSRIEPLVDSPAIAWTSDPFGTNELLSFTLGIRL